jgi:beta-galactosidase
VRNGRLENINAAPQQRAKVNIATGAVAPDAEWLLNVSFRLKSREGLLPAGHIVAKNQLRLTDATAADMELKNITVNNVPPAVPVIKDNDYNYLIVAGENFRIEFDKHSGYMTKYNVEGVEMIKEGERLKPNFWRAPTDNDFGANLQHRYRVWNNPAIRLKELKRNIEEGLAVVEADYEMPGVKAKLTIKYIVNNAGAVKVTQSMIADKEAKVYGSQGQQRTTALSLKLSELEVMHAELGEWPVLMLDDVMSELDPERRRHLLSRLEGVQTLVTCTDRDDLAGAHAGKIYRVDRASLSDVAI